MLELSKQATRPTSGQPMTGSGFGGPGLKGSEDKQTKKNCPSPALCGLSGQSGYLKLLNKILHSKRPIDTNLPKLPISKGPIDAKLPKLPMLICHVPNTTYCSRHCHQIQFKSTLIQEKKEHKITKQCLNFNNSMHFDFKVVVQLQMNEISATAKTRKQYQ